MLRSNSFGRWSSVPLAPDEILASGFERHDFGASANYQHVREIEGDRGVASRIRCRVSIFHFLNREKRVSISPSCSHFSCDPDRLHQLFLRGAVP